MKKNIKAFALVLSILILTNFHALSVLAAPQSWLTRLDKSTDKVYQQNTDLMSVIAYVINAFFAILGIIFVVIILIAGYDWLTAGGDSGKAKKGTDQIRFAIIGMLIMLGSFAIWEFILTNFLNKVGSLEE